MSQLQKIITTLQHLIPPPLAIGWPERARACAGGLFGIFITGFLTALIFPGESHDIAWLVAPIGASSVLLFATPASPLAQPWSIIGGNLISALIGITCARWIQLPMLACALSVAVSMAAMLALRCLHPPGGAVALTAVLGGPAVHAAGYDLLWFPIGVNCLLIVGLGLFFHNATGHRYPHRLHGPAAKLPASPSPLLQITRADLDTALHESDEILDIDLDDLELIVRCAEQQALKRMSHEAPRARLRRQRESRKRSSR